MFKLRRIRQLEQDVLDLKEGVATLGHYVRADFSNITEIQNEIKRIVHRLQMDGIINKTIQ